MIQAVIIHLGWSFLSGFFFYVAITHTNIWSTCWTIQNNGNQQQTGRFPWSPATPGFVSFCFQVRWQRGFICPNGLDCNTSSDIIFVILQPVLVFHCGCWRRRTSLCLQEPREWQSQDWGSQPWISCLVCFQQHQQGTAIPHLGDSPTVMLSHTVYVQGGSGEGREHSPGSGSCWAFAGSSSAFPVPRDTALFSVDSKSGVCKHFFCRCSSMFHLLLSSDQAVPC